MKTLRPLLLCLLLLVPSSLLLPRASYAQPNPSGYSVTIHPSPPKLIVGEEFVVKWTVPLGTFTLDDWLGVFLLEASNRNPISWKVAAFRGSETTFGAPENRGDYHVRYFEWNLFRGSRLVATSETLYVRLSVEDPFAIRNYPGRGKTIVAFGDSLVAGVGAKPGEDFPSVLSRLLGRPIHNAGVAGNTTEDGLKRFQTDVLDKRPRIVIILIGGNNILKGMSPAQTIEDIRTMITKAHAQGTVVILVGVQGGLFTDRLREGFHGLAEETKVAYVPNILRGIIGNPFRSSDAVHPNRAGYKLMADRILPALEGLGARRRRVPLSIANHEDGKITLSWNSFPGETYRVLACTNLSAPDFAPLDVAPVIDGGRCSVGLPAIASAQFFQVEMEEAEEAIEE